MTVGSEPASAWDIAGAVITLLLLVVVVLLAFSGCAALGMRGQRVEIERQAVAVHVIWHDTYGRTDKAPGVRWVQKLSDLTCVDPNSGRPGFKTSAGCREGYTLMPWEVSVAWHEGDNFATTALAHELLHQDLWRRGIMDPNHKRQEWFSLAKCEADKNTDPRCALVEKANVALNGV